LSAPPRTGVVVGGGSGIGRATALALAADGFAVAIGDLDGERAEETANLVRTSGGAAQGSVVDVRSRGQTDALVAAAVERFGGLDVACNAAGIGAPRATVADTAPADLEAVFGVNLVGAWNCMASELPRMAAAGSGVIVNLASATALRAAPGIAAYAAAKAALVHLSRTAAVEYAAAGVRVHALCPGPIRTPMLERLPPERLEALAAGVPAGRLGEPAEVAAAVAWLCSPAATYMTGAVVPVDGGESA
jgi:NAD(P)-dependent dehydrogenase (short-subunit alcohol dehydrogenase family)